MDDSEEEEQEVGWKRLLRIRSSSAPPLSKQPRYVAAGPSAHVRLGGDVEGEEAALHREGGGAPVDASRDRTQPASHSDAPLQSAHHTGAGARVARTESMAAGGSSSVHEYDGSGVIQLTGDREPPNLREQQLDPEFGIGGHNANRGLPGSLENANPERAKNTRTRKRSSAKRHGPPTGRGKRWQSSYGPTTHDGEHKTTGRVRA